MKKSRWFIMGVIVAWLTCSAVHGQQGSSKSIYPAPQPIPINGDAAPVTGTYMPPSGGLSDYIVYRRECCEGRPGNYAPLYTELYLRSGWSTPIGGPTLSRELQSGWSIAGGARALFFNSELTEAWTVDVHIINTFERSREDTTAFP